MCIYLFCLKRLVENKTHDLERDEMGIPTCFKVFLREYSKIDKTEPTADGAEVSDVPSTINYTDDLDEPVMPNPKMRARAVEKTRKVSYIIFISHLLCF